MSDVTATMIKDLRVQSGAGMMDCKTALVENGGDMEAAIDWLRTKGLMTAASKSGRVAADGLIGVAASGTSGAVVEVNSETDFVARNETFQGMVSKVADIALAEGGDLAALMAAEFESGQSVEAHIADMIATIGENMSVRRTAALEVGSGVVAHYVHNRIGDDLGKIGVLVALESTGDAGKLHELAHQIAMHIAASAPLAVNVEDLDPAVVERERKVLVAEAAESGKPAEIIDKMVEGRLRKFHEDVVLTAQTFVIDGERRVGQVVEDAAAEMGAEVTLKDFVCFRLGEGIDKGESDFAAEVAATVAETDKS